MDVGFGPGGPFGVGVGVEEGLVGGDGFVKAFELLEDASFSEEGCGVEEMPGAFGDKAVVPGEGVVEVEGGFVGLGEGEFGVGGEVVAGMGGEEVGEVGAGEVVASLIEVGGAKGEAGKRGGGGAGEAVDDALELLGSGGGGHEEAHGFLFLGEIDVAVDGDADVTDDGDSDADEDGESVFTEEIHEFRGGMFAQGIEKRSGGGGGRGGGAGLGFGFFVHGMEFVAGRLPDAQA